MAKGQQQVVDVAALRGIGRSTHGVREPNRSMDRFLEYAGGVAVNLFSKAWQTKKLANQKNQEFLAEKSTELRDMSDEMRSIIQPELDKIGGILSKGVKDEYGLFNTPITGRAKERSLSGVDAQVKGRNRASNIHDNAQAYMLTQKKFYTVHHDGVIIDDEGVAQKASWGGHNLPGTINFSQAYANGDTDNLIMFDENGRMGMNSNVIDMLQRGHLLGVKANSDLIKELNKTGEFIPVEDWPLARMSETGRGNSIVSGIDDLTLSNGANYKYDANVHGKNYSNFIKKNIYGDSETKPMTDNEIASWIWDGVGVGERPFIEDFIENPTFDVIIDHDADPNTPKVAFDGIAEYIKRTFGGKLIPGTDDTYGPEPTYEDLNEKDKGLVEVWKQGVTNELKVAMDPRGAETLNWLENQLNNYAKEGHDDVWGISKNNPDNAPALNELQQAELNALNQKPQTVDFGWGPMARGKTEDQIDDETTVRAISSGQGIVKIGHDIFEKQKDGQYLLIGSTATGTFVGIDKYSDTNKTGAKPKTKVKMIQQYGGIYSNIPNKHKFFEDIQLQAIKGVLPDVKEAKQGSYYHDTESGIYYQFKNGEYIEIYKPKK
tara:strand:- start:1393 stop:3204 length:1812 start_codon:yes stop_codon:yes gene_type:complete